MNHLLTRMEQCLYKIKHESKRPIELTVKEAINETEIALQQLIRTIESHSKETDDSTRNTAT